MSQPSCSTAIKVIVDRCEGLLPAGASALSTKPYVHYRWVGGCGTENACLRR